MWLLPMLHDMKPIWVILGVIALVVFVACLQVMIEENCDAKGGTLRMYGKIITCEVPDARS